MTFFDKEHFLLKKVALLCTLFCLALLLAPVHLQLCAQEAEPSPELGTAEASSHRVLVITEQGRTLYGKLHPWQTTFQQRLFRLFSEKPNVLLSRFDIPIGADAPVCELERLSTELEAMLQPGQYDLVVAVLETPCHILTQIAERLPPELPLLFCTDRDWSARIKAHHPNVSFIEARRMPLETVRLALTLQPQTRQILFISNDTTHNEELEELVGPASAYRDCKITFLSKEGRSMDELLEAVAGLPERSLVVLDALEAPGTSPLGLSPLLALEIARQAATVPCFATSQLPLHMGAVGGYGVPAMEFADATSLQIQRVLEQGNAVDVMPLVPDHIALVDISVALEHGLKVDELPADARKLFEPPPYWNPSYKTLVVAFTLLAITLVSLLAMFLIYKRYRHFTRQAMAIFKELPVRVSVIDRQNNLLFCQIERGLRDPAAPVPRHISYFKDISPEEVANTVAWVVETREPTTIHHVENGKKRVVTCSPLEKAVFGTDAIVAVSQDVSEVEKARSKAEELAEQHRIILEAVDDGLMMTDVEGKIILMNRLAAELTGWRRLEVVGKQLEEVLQLEDSSTGKPFPSPVHKVLQDKREYSRNESAILVSKKGERYHLAHGAFPVGDSDGSFTGVVIVFRDITEEYQNRSQVVSALQTFKFATKLANLSSFHYDPAKGFELEGDKESFNWAYREGQPINVEEWIIPEDLEKFKAAWEQLIDGKSDELTLSYRSNYTGSLRYYTMMASAWQQEGSRERRIFGVIQDLTHIGESERKLHDTSQLFETIMERLSCYVYARDIDDDFRYILENQRLRDFFAQFGADVHDKTIYDLNDKLAQNELYKVNLDTVVEGKTAERTATITDKEGQEHILKILETQIRQSDGRRLLLGVAVDVTELRETQKREGETREFLQLILDYLPACVSAKDVEDEFRYVIWNKELERHTGLNAEEVRGKTDFEIDAYPGFAEDFRRMDEQVAGLGRPMQFVVDCVSAKGEPLTYNSYKMPIRNHEGKELLLELSLDISREKKLERERIDMIKRLNDLLESGHIVNECLRRITLEENFEKVVREMLGVIGDSGGADRCYVYEYRPGEKKAKCLFEWTRSGLEDASAREIHPSILMDELSSWSELLERKEEIVIRDVSNPPENLKDISHLLQERNAKSMIASGIWVDGKLWGFIGLDFVLRRRDINKDDLRTIHNAVNLFQLAHERNRRKNALAEGSFRQRQIFDHIDIPIALFDIQCNVIISNPSYNSLMKQEDSNSICKEYIGRLSSQSGGPGSAPIPTRSKVEALGRHQLELVRYAEREYVVNLQPIFDRQDRLALILETAVDVTDINESKRQLETAMQAALAADRAKSYFLATMSHELRTPLNAVIGFSELLQTSVLSDEQQKDYLQSIHVAGNALLSLINDVLDLSKIEADQTQITPRKTALILLMDEIEAIFRKKAEAKGLALEVYCPPELPMLYLDILRLRQILLNLTGNAIKFTHEGKVKLRVDFQETDDTYGALRLIVADTGIGVKKEYQEKIFEPFVQQDSIRGGRTYEGTGLGLPISQRLAQKMGGELLLESEEDKGSTFTILLERVQYEKQSPDRAHSSPLPQPVLAALPEGYLVLLVDDVEMNVQVLASALKNLGVATKMASSGEEALKILEEYAPQLVMTDVWMPGMDGSELARSIRRNPRWDSVKIVAVTADTEVGHSFNMKHFDDVLLKPLTLKKILAFFHKLYLPEAEEAEEE
ncbi:MAG: PAS domain-containing protein [Limisphaerales bacterium]|jgi:PAS domain S-box-containing protein|nr:PAS domain-containing protein [Verrucomicrobiota bacterium]